MRLTVGLAIVGRNLSAPSTPRESEKNETPWEQCPAGLQSYTQPKDVDLGSIDVFLIDGIARGACLATLAARLPRKKPAVIFLHDTKRDWYVWAMNLFDQPWVRFAPDGYPAELARLILLPPVQMAPAIEKDRPTSLPLAARLFNRRGA